MFILQSSNDDLDTTFSPSDMVIFLNCIVFIITNVQSSDNDSDDDYRLQQTRVSFIVFSIYNVST